MSETFGLATGEKIFKSVENFKFSFYFVVLHKNLFHSIFIDGF